MRSLTEIDLMTNNLRIKMMPKMISSITTDLSTHSREPEILPRLEDHPNSTFHK